jgi:membrane protein DedA with SNARE-associated domain
LPQSSNIRAWMTLRYIVTTYKVPENMLIERLELSPDTSLDLTLKSLADRKRISPLQYVQNVQRLLAENIGPADASKESGPRGILDRLTDELLSALLKYGYPALALTLLLGAIGLPVPTGLSAAIAGSLSSSGQMDWLTAIEIGIAASVLGDVVAYGLGRSVGTGIIERHGHWIGLTKGRQARVEPVLKRWGAIAVLISRTLVSSLSSIVSFVAGMSRYRFSLFLIFVILGRTVWTASYVGLGYGVGDSLDAATSFLANLSGAILSAFILAAAVVVALGRVDRLISEARGRTGP